jgi:tRNA/rRNA methyltransferase
MMMQPVVILVKPQLAENIGMAARAMKNCGLKELRVVAPEQSPTSEIALRASSNSEEVLLNAKIYGTTEEAVADLEVLYAATARPRHQVKEVQTAEFAAQHLPKERKIGFMFGCERTGLENKDVSLADKIIEVPLNPEHSSLNLAQAVLVIGYEYYKTTIAAEGSRFITNGGKIAEKEKVFKFLDMLNGRIKESPRLKDEEHVKTLLINVNNIFTRAELTEQELNSLYGVVNILSDNR